MKQFARKGALVLGRRFIRTVAAVALIIEPYSESHDKYPYRAIDYPVSKRFFSRISKHNTLHLKCIIVIFPLFIHFIADTKNRAFIMLRLCVFF